LDGIYTSVILRDVVERKKITDLALLRKLAPLRSIPDNYERFILSMDRNFVTSYNGIKVINLIDGFHHRNVMYSKASTVEKR
jgi:predicted AAA+ superfamily ATPase